MPAVHNAGLEAEAVEKVGEGISSGAGRPARQ